MLDSVEYYDFELEEWVESDPLAGGPKCAFAVTTVLNKFIYLFGGYDTK